MSLLARTSTGAVRDLVCTDGGALHTSFVPPLEFRYSIGAVAGGALVSSPVIDLGLPENRIYSLVMAQKIGLASSGERFGIYFSDDGTTFWPTNASVGAPDSAWTNYSNWQMCMQGRPLGRYVRVQYINGSTAQTSLLLAITMFAGI